MSALVLGAPGNGVSPVVSEPTGFGTSNRVHGPRCRSRAEAFLDQIIIHDVASA